MSYRVLVLPEQDPIPLEVLQKLGELVSEGATIIGPRPTAVPGLHNYESKTAALRELASEMWGACNGTTVKTNHYGKGRIVWGITPQEWLIEESVGPDFTCQDDEHAGSLDYIHRQTEYSDIYFVRNKTMSTVHAECQFRVNSRSPHIWDPADGTMKELFVYRTVDGGTSLPLHLSPGRSVFIVFDKSPGSGSFASLVRTGDNTDTGLPVEQVVAVKDHTATIHCWQNGQYLLVDSKGQEALLDVQDLPAPLELDGGWRVEFNPEWGAPEEVMLPELISWTDHAEEGVRYYSGNGTYHRTIDIPAGWLCSGHRVHLDLGDVRELAEIYVNGQSAGVLWKSPFRADVTPFLKPGENVLEIEVMNLWINRLSGDMNLPPDERYTRTNISSDGATRKVPAEPWHVQPAGLLGPVRLLPSVQVPVKSRDRAI
jgi:hypothetical protein